MDMLDVFQPLPELLVQLRNRFYQASSWPELSVLSLVRPLMACVAIYLVLLHKTSALTTFPGPGPWPIVRFGNMPIIVVNSATAAKEILTSSAAALSSRPIFHTFHQFIAGTLGPTIGTAVYGNALKRGREATAAELSKPAVKANLDKINLETRHLIHELLIYGSEGRSPLLVSPLVKRLALNLSVSICYGRRMYLGNPLTQEIISVEHKILKLRSMTDNAQDFLAPAARLATQQKLPRAGRGPARAARVATESNMIHWGLVLLATRPDVQETALLHIREAYPDVAKVFGEPLRDTEDIPYISALVREILRFYTPSRLALPRLTVQPIVYQDKIIPDGNTVVLNTFACNREPKLFRDPDTFRPERWLEDPDQAIFSYGLGYRMCAGYTLANHVLYALFVRLIAAFAVSAEPGVDADPITGCESAGHQAMARRPTGLYFKPREATLLRAALARDVHCQIVRYRDCEI
ncbi:Cytochrome P450 [Cordyceps fumosorosea ARSEF 2679]|uniref:Cytochrome P450 n=1 Tax=Cordyceps fumosorosea (strain ARSEF 2679) TaxID=1081104 RepID=A0A167P8U6_CORFA|nr:Cytochrome P450 [Cordyceps fumosorosea ARSEF 2679]OAA56406.1 Cytochrome P450 [Cordyceps fumosorosea ARSEF 2679]